MSRAHTKEEAREMVLDHIRVLTSYWDSLPDKTPKQRLDGLAFSILAMIDGATMLPAIDLVMRPHDSDKAYSQENGDNWFEDGLVLNDDCALHEMLYKRPDPKSPTVQEPK